MRTKINSLKKILKKRNLDGFLFSGTSNFNYLSGSIMPEGWMLFASSKELIYFTNSLHSNQTASWPVKTIVANTDLAQTISKKAKKLKLKKVGFAENKISLSFYRQIKEKMDSEGVSLIKSTPLVEKLRAIKSKKEINLIKKAASFSLEAFDYGLEILNPNMTEKDLAIELERFLRIKSDNQLAFPSIVASGKNTAFPHHNPGKTKIINQLLIDLGARHSGYCSDLTRIFFWGKMPASHQRVHKVVKEAQIAAIKKIRAGRKVSEIDKAARGIIEKNGLGKFFLHGTGHGIGLQTHEPPYLRPKSDEVLKEGMVVTIEPAVYCRQKFGIRLEEMVIVKTKKGEVIS